MLIKDPGACGLAYLLAPAEKIPQFSASGYSVVAWECVSPNYSFAHELGHNQGAQHDLENSGGGQGAYSYSFGFKRCWSPPFFRSIMAYPCGGFPGRSLNFSNPLVAFDGEPTGTPAENNALTLHNTRASIAAFRQEQYLVRVTSLWPPADVAVGQTATLRALVVNDGPYSLPASAQVWFFADGPGMTSGEGWVGLASLSGLASGTGAWYAFDLAIPATAPTGTWSYSARVWDSAAPDNLSDWSSSQNFAVLSVDGSVLGGLPVPVTSAGTVAQLWAQVQNTGAAAFPAGTEVWFSVSGPDGFSEYVGSSSVSGLAPGATSCTRSIGPSP